MLLRTMEYPKYKAKYFQMHFTLIFKYFIELF